MASLEDLEDLERERDDERDKKKKKDDDKNLQDGDSKMEDAKESKEAEVDDSIDPEILNSATQDIINRRRLLENDVRVMKQEHQRLMHEKTSMQKRIEENLEKIENNRYVVLIREFTYLTAPGAGDCLWRIAIFNFNCP